LSLIDVTLALSHCVSSASPLSSPGKLVCKS
jgi:hypothetical protein